MKRKIITVFVFLLLGAIVNVAVAWTWWLWPAPIDFDYVPASDGIATWSDWAPADWVHFNGIWMQMNGVAVTWEAGFRQTGEVVGRDTPALAVYSEGWPLRSMQGSEIRQRWEMDSLLNRDGRFIAMKPLWPGFAINTLLYAGILCGGWLLFAAPFALRRRRRMKRGLCPACAYPVGDSEVCTECGGPVAPKEMAA